MTRDARTRAAHAAATADARDLGSGSGSGGSKIDVTPLVEELTPVPDPVRCCEQLAGLPYRLFLDSAIDNDTARALFVSDRRSVRRDQRKGSSDALDAVRARLAPFHAEPIAWAAAVSGWSGRLHRLRLGSDRSNVCRRRATTISRCPMWCWASTTGCSRGITSPRARG